MRAGGDHGLLWLVALALFGSLISLYYYLVVLRVIFLPPSRDFPAPEVRRPLPFLSRITIAGLAGVILLLGCLPGSLVTPILAALR
jgi:NADH:ubiquinone oxidoreductase subunit 2 (subunit N)